MTREEEESYLRLLQEKERRDAIWKPLPGPQTMAFESKVDIIGYGGAATAFTSIYSTGVYIAQNVHTAGSVSTAGTLTAPSFGDTVELLLRISQNGSIYLGESINLGNESVTASSAALAQDSAWSVPTFFFNALGASSSIGFAAFQRAIVAPGTSWSMAQLRAA